VPLSLLVSPPPRYCCFFRSKWASRLLLQGASRANQAVEMACLSSYNTNALPAAIDVIIREAIDV
jgi:hypothetical protein